MEELVVLTGLSVGALHVGTNRNYTTEIAAGTHLSRVTLLGRVDGWVLISESASGMWLSFPEEAVHIYSPPEDRDFHSPRFGERN